jgi:hypothetical protein
MTMEELEELNNKPMHLDFGGSAGLRYWRDWTEARRDGRLVPPGWKNFVSGAASSKEPEAT